MRLTAYVDELKTRLEKTQAKLDTSESNASRINSILQRERSVAQSRMNALEVELGASRQAGTKLRAEIASRPSKPVLSEASFGSAVSSALANEERTEQHHAQVEELATQLKQLTEERDELHVRIKGMDDARAQLESEHAEFRSTAENEIHGLKSALAALRGESLPQPITPSAPTDDSVNDNGAVFDMDARPSDDVAQDVAATAVSAQEENLIDFDNKAPPNAAGIEAVAQGDDVGCCDYDATDSPCVQAAAMEMEEGKDTKDNTIVPGIPVVLGALAPTRAIGACTGSLGAFLARRSIKGNARPLSAGMDRGLALQTQTVEGTFSRIVPGTTVEIRAEAEKGTSSLCEAVIADLRVALTASVLRGVAVVDGAERVEAI